MTDPITRYAPTVRTLCGAIYLSCSIGAVAAETTQYVSDNLEITMRSGESTRHQIVRMLSSGTPLEVLEENTETGYSRVRDPKGTVGYVLTRYLMNLPSAQDRLAETQKKQVNTEIETKRLKEEIKQRNEEHKSLAAEKQQLEEDARKLDLELNTIRKTAASTLAIDQENRTNKARLVTIEQDLQVLKQENEALKDRTARDWFMVGAGVILLGMVIGLIIPKIRWQKKSSWDSL